MKLTKERLEAIRQRAEKATPGPWVTTALLDHIAELEAELARLKQTDKVRELYEWARTAQKKFAKEGEYTKADARMDGILLTLDALGITIEGVND
jgi:hypothetical protein